MGLGQAEKVFALSPNVEIEQKIEKNKERKISQVWAIGGGKGGVGKSFVTANLALSLAFLGNSVLAIDCDFGGANLHTCLGIAIPQKTLSDFFLPGTKVTDLIVSTNLPNLKIISGAQDHVNITGMRHFDRFRLLKEIKSLDFDFILFDLGAGTTQNTLDFFTFADKGIMATLPEPTAIENTYRFIRSAFFHYLTKKEELLEFVPLIEDFVNSKMSENKSPYSIVEKIREYDSRGAIILDSIIRSYSPKLILNQTRSFSDLDIGDSMSLVCKKYFGISLEFIGGLEYDPMVWQSVKKRRPLLLEFPSSPLVRNFEMMLGKLLKNGVL